MSPVKYHFNFPPKNLQWKKITPLLGDTYSVIARYDSLLEFVGNKQILLSPLTTQEAVLSSRIEGTQATMAEVLQFEAQGDNQEFQENKRLDIAEIINYRVAMTEAVTDLKKLPICNQVVLKAHKKLMSGVRGHNKTPGQYRKIANWIGPEGSTKKQAYYISPPANEVSKLMGQWEKFINSEYTDKLVQLALLHVEFEAIHPFLDGNGRLGRMLIPLFMFQKKMIQQPVFYISEYLEAHRDEYYQRLRSVSKNHDWVGWCLFFLKAVKAQANNNLEKINKILNLYNDLKDRLPQLTHSQFATPLLDAIFKRPIFTLNSLVQNASISSHSARRLVKILEKNNIVKTYNKPKGRRPAIMIFPELFNIAEGKNIF